MQGTVLFKGFKAKFFNMFLVNLVTLFSPPSSLKGFLIYTPPQLDTHCIGRIAGKGKGKGIKKERKKER
jgi:hypothetical protein